MELLTGTLDGKKGSFALQHSGTMDAQGQVLQITVTPGSGSGAGELTGISGRFRITVANGQHSYDMDYMLPASK